MAGRATVGLSVVAPKTWWFAREEEWKAWGVAEVIRVMKARGWVQWCSRVPIAVVGTVAASLVWLRRCDEGASHAEHENEGALAKRRNEVEMVTQMPAAPSTVPPSSPAFKDEQTRVPGAIVVCGDDEGRGCHGEIEL